MSATISVNKLHYALVTTNSESRYVYGTPKRILGINKISINPNPDTDSIKTNTAQMRKPALLGLIEIDFISVNITPEQRAEMLGHTIDVDGVEHHAYDNKSPLIALGFESEKSNGKKKFVWILAGRMKENVSDYITRGNSVELSIPKMVGFFRHCKKTKDWKIVLDEDSVNFNQTKADSWYTTIPV